MTSDLTLESAGEWQNIRHKTRPDLSETQIGFNVVQDVTRRDGTYRPARNLPVQYTRGNWVDAEGIVISQGKILGKYDKQIWDGAIGSGGAWAYGDSTKRFGVQSTATGEFYGYKDVNGVAKLLKFNEPVFGYSGDIGGLIAPMNGHSTSEIQDYYSAFEKQLGSLDPVTGTLAGVGTGFESKGTLRGLGDPANSTFELVGVAQRDIMRETRNNSYQYQREIEAHGVAKDGYLYVPFVIGKASNTATVGETDLLLDQAVVTNPTTANGTSTYELSRQRLVSMDQTVLFVEDPGVLQHGAVVTVDMWGNPFLGSTAGLGATFNLDFGTIVNFTFAIDIPYGDYAQTYPFIEVAGSSTLGIDHALMYLGRKIKGDIPAKTLANHLRDSKLYGWAKIRFDIP